MERDEDVVRVRRQWSDDRVGSVPRAGLANVHWDTVSGGVRAHSPWPFLHGYISCDSLVDGEVSHSGVHGPCPHRIKVCVVKKDNPGPVYAELEAQAGTKPEPPPRCRAEALRLIEEEPGIRGPELRSKLGHSYAPQTVSKALSTIRKTEAVRAVQDGPALRYYPAD